ncbi:MAG TPA: ATP synthase F1 subunit gamma [Candidatus Saccharimonadales bacterium]|nr:ATP synthase F1 subunit gamma [Candidatus Saccharimonadales bacterium]
MASRQQIKRRIASVKNTKQITKAMQLVSASKLRRAQDAAVGPRAYAEMARAILAKLKPLAREDGQFQLFTPRPVKARLLILVASDRGLAGAYNANIVRTLVREAQADREAGVQTSVIAIGRQVANAIGRISDLDVRGVYTDLPDKPDADALRPVLTTAVGAFADGEIDAVDMIYTKFISTVNQQVQVRRILPAGFDQEEGDTAAEMTGVTVEPSPEVLLRSVAMRLLDAQIYQAILEAFASEHSMRMLAMKTATDNATELAEDLTLAYNNARQAAITQELAEISGGAEAMK